MYVPDGRLGRQVGRLTGFGINIDLPMFNQMRGRSIFNPRPVYLPICRPADHPEYTYMANRILYT